MNGAKFASITSSLLARKGEAQPWAQEALTPPPVLRDEVRHAVSAPTPSVWRDDVRPAVCAPPPPPGRDRSCSVRMSAHDYERLGILAVKNGTTRKQLLKDALAQFLTSKAQDHTCACLGACDRSCAGGN